jgi:hypothetical protein
VNDDEEQVPEVGDSVRLSLRGKPHVGVVTEVKRNDHRGTYIMVETHHWLVCRWPREVQVVKED